MIIVTNKYVTTEGEYIGRGNPLGNPYTHLEGTTAQFKVATREEAVAKYGPWLVEQIKQKNWPVINELNRLLILARDGDLKLRCFCAPKACHGDVVKVFLEAKLKERKIFVFGSNLGGNHGAGAALAAKREYGAEQGVSEGLTGWSYAIPTCDRWDPSSRRFPALNLDMIWVYVRRFLHYAEKRPDLRFQVTRVGCGLAGHRDQNIAPMFASAPENCSFDQKWDLWLPNKEFWGTY